MKSKDTPAIIASRKLKIGRQLVVVSVRIPEPVQSHEWRCRYEIRGGKTETHYAFGADGLQALILALQGIRANLEATKKPVTWLGSPLELAFPLPVPYFGWLSFTRRIQRLIDRETKKYVKQLEDPAFRRRERRKQPRV